MKKVSVAFVFLLASSLGHAQLGGLLKDLKGLADKTKQQAQQPATPATEKSVPQTGGVVVPTGQDAIIPKLPANVLPTNMPVDVSKAFRSIWCKSTDSSVNGPMDYKGIRTGDLCQLPDDVIVAIESRLKSNKQPFEWMTQPKVLTEGGSIVTKFVKSGDKLLLALAMVVDPYIEKAYLGSFTGLICAADPTNSLNVGNPFRKALEAKYGVPVLSYTEYDQLKAQIADLEAMNNRSREQAITVRDAKNVRDVNNMLPTLKSMLAAADKNAILSLTWDYEAGNKIRPIGTVSINQASASDIRELGGCPVSVRQGRDFDEYYGFQIGFMASKSLTAVAEGVDAKNQAKQKEKVQNAPAPKF